MEFKTKELNHDPLLQQMVCDFIGAWQQLILLILRIMTLWQHLLLMMIFALIIQLSMKALALLTMFVILWVNKDHAKIMEESLPLWYCHLLHDHQQMSTDIEV